MISSFHVKTFFSGSIKFCLFAFLTLNILCTMPFIAAAQTGSSAVEETTNDEWERHLSLSGIFEVKFPQKYKYKLYPFRYSDEKIAFSVEILGSLDSNDENSDRNVMVNAVQTFGEYITLRQAKSILAREVAKYALSAKKIGASVLAKEDIESRGFPGKRLYITYNDNGKKYGMRIHIYITEYAKVEQVITAPADVVYSYRSDSFFDSLKLYDGITTLEEPVEFAKGWEEHTAKNATYTVKLPPQNSVYTPYPPQFSITPAMETMRFSFVDPVVEETVFYNVYSYKLKNNIDYDTAKRILFSQHVKQYAESASIENFETKSSISNHIYEMNSRMIISPPEDKPYISSLMLKIFYAGDTAVVQEILSSGNHTKAGLPDLLFNEILTFHPERYKPPQIESSPE